LITIMPILAFAVVRSDDDLVGETSFVGGLLVGFSSWEAHGWGFCRLDVTAAARQTLERQRSVGAPDCSGPKMRV
jgi:hypothetical protein